MTLKTFVDNLDSVDESARGFYKKTDDGKYRLDADFQDPAGLKSALEREREARKEARKQLEEYQQRLDQWGDLDPSQVKELMSRFQKDEDLELLRTGQKDKLFQKYFGDHLRQTTSQIEQLRQEAKDNKDKAVKFQDAWQRARIDNEVGSKLGSSVEDGLMDIAQSLVRPWYKVNDEGEIEPTEKAPIKDGKPLSFSDIKQYLIEHRPGLFKASRGAGLIQGNGSVGLSHDQLMKLSPTERIKRVRRAQAK